MLTVHEHIAQYGPERLSEEDLVRAIVGKPLSANGVAFATTTEIQATLGISATKAAMLSAALELGRRFGWAPPKAGERCLDPQRVYDLLRRQAHEQVESFFVVMLDVRGRLLGYERIAKGSLSQCPVSPRDTLRAAIRSGAHSIVLAHNHPSGDPSPSADDMDLTERLRAAAELVGVICRDHVIVAAGGYYSFVEAGRWRR